MPDQCQLSTDLHTSAMHRTMLRADVEALLSRYLIALDARDFGALEACFATDATAHYDRPLTGVAAILAHLQDAMGRCVASTHIGGVAVLSEDAEGVSVESSALAFLVEERGEGTGIRVRGLRYRDRLTGQSGRLVFRHRERVASWTFEVPGRRLAGPPP